MLTKPQTPASNAHVMKLDNAVCHSPSTILRYSLSRLHIMHSHLDSASWTPGSSSPADLVYLPNCDDNRITGFIRTGRRSGVCVWLRIRALLCRMAPWCVKRISRIEDEVSLAILVGVVSGHIGRTMNKLIHISLKGYCCRVHEWYIFTPPI